MLNVKTIKEEYKILDNKVYAIYEDTGEKREVNGCEVRKELTTEISDINKQLEDLESFKKKLTNQLSNYLILDGKLKSLGYCKIDNAVYKKIDGIVIKDSDGNPVISSYTHSESCSHKEA